MPIAFAAQARPPALSVRMDTIKLKASLESVFGLLDVEMRVLGIPGAPQYFGILVHFSFTFFFFFFSLGFCFGLGNGLHGSDGSEGNYNASLVYREE